MKVLGITGGTGCGKTTLLARVEARGGAVIDCDRVYHELLKTDRALLSALESRFPGVVENGALERRKLGKLVFEDPAALADLNALVHPAVCGEAARRLERARETGAALAAIDAVALVESGLGALCDGTVAVTADPEHRVRRLMAREGISEEYARLRIAAQKSDAQFAAQCGMVLHNDFDSAAAFSAACDRFLERWLSGAGPDGGGNG